MVELRKFDVSKIEKLIEKYPHVPELRYAKARVKYLNDELDMVKWKLSTCEIEDAIERYGDVVEAITDIKALLYEKIPPIFLDDILEIVSELGEIKEKLTKIVTDGIKTCSIKGLIR